MAVATLTELNRNPSRLAQIAEREPVHIRRYGRGYLVLRREEDPVEDLRAAGLIRPPVAVHDGELPTLNLTSEQGEALYDEFLASRRVDD